MGIDLVVRDTEDHDASRCNISVRWVKEVQVDDFP